MTEVVVNTCFKEEAINNYHQIPEEANPVSSEAALTIDQPETSTSPTDPSTTANPWKEFDMLTAVVSRYHMPLEKGCLPPFNPMALSAAPSVAAPSPVGANPNDHRISCHRCGNIRKRKTVCSRANCPHTFCGRCTDKLKLEYGHEVFANGCPVCKDLCCCSNKSVNCTRKFHCYRKCPATKVTTPKNATTTVSTSSSPTASAMTMPSTMADCSNDETTSVEENSATSIIGQKQHRMNALLEACANFDETHKAGVEGEEEGRKNKKQKTSKSVAENSLAMLGVDPSVCAPTTVKVKKERKSTSSAASSSSSNAHNNSHAVAAANAMPMPSYPMPFYGFPHGAMAAAGPYGMIPLVPAHMLQGYNLPPQYGKMAGLEANDDAEMMYGKGVPPLIPVFPYYMPQYAAAMQAQSKSTNSKSSKAIPLPLPMHQASGINLLAAVSSHYLSDEEENLNSSITATPAEIPSN